MRFALLTAAVLSTSLLSGCGALQAVSDTSVGAYRAVFYKKVKELNVDLTARAALNPDDAGRATSVAVRIYQLKDRKLFDGASYDDLLKNDKSVLAQDLQATVGTVVNPGASASISEPMNFDTRYVAVAAFFREPDRDGGWRRVIAKKKLSADKPLKLELMNGALVASDEKGKSD
jgi:type VI secretion system protein VasD